MGPVNWLAVLLAAMLALAVAIVWHGPLFRSGRPVIEGPGAPSKTIGYLLALGVMLLASVLIGHNFARVGSVTLAAKPHLFLMMSAGLALFLVMPAVWLSLIRRGVRGSEIIVDLGFWLAVYLAIGVTFWALA